MIYRREVLTALFSLGFAGVFATSLLGDSAQKTSPADQKSTPKESATQSSPAKSETNRPAASGAASQTVKAVPGTPSEPFTLEGTDVQRMLHRDVNAVPTRNPDRSMGLSLKGGYQNVLVVRITAGGKPEIACVTTEQQAKAFLDPAQPVTPTPVSSEGVSSEKKVSSQVKDH